MERRAKPAELVRQTDYFQAHGVHSFVIHPRVGLPRSIGWMSGSMRRFVRFAVEEAARQGMTVVLYDVAKYPSESSSGGAVAAGPDFRCRGLENRPIRTLEEDVFRVAAWTNAATNRYCAGRITGGYTLRDRHGRGSKSRRPIRYTPPLQQGAEPQRVAQGPPFFVWAHGGI